MNTDKLATIKFNLDHYYPIKPSPNIFVVDNKACQCRELVVSADLDNLIIGQNYSISYSTLNNTALFDPSEQTIRAAANQQKFSTIMFLDPAKTHIVKAEISGTNILASQMCVIKCGELRGCDVPSDSNIVLNSYNNWEYRFDDFLVFKFIPMSGHSDVVISVASLPEIAPPSNLKLLHIPLINASTDILLNNTKVGTLIYLTRFDNRSVVMTKNNQNYTGTISPGVSHVV